MRKFLSGLSLIEVVVAIGVFSVATLGVLLALTRVMMAQSGSSHQTLGRLVADSVLSEATLAGPPNWGNPDPSVPVQTRRVRVGQNDRLEDFSFRVTAVPVPSTNESGGALFALGPAMGALYQVEVQVWWNSDAGPTGAVELGKQELTLRKVVYIED